MFKFFLRKLEELCGEFGRIAGQDADGDDGGRPRKNSGYKVRATLENLLCILHLDEYELEHAQHLFPG